MRQREYHRLVRKITECRQAAHAVLSGEWQFDPGAEAWATEAAKELLGHADVMERFLVDQGYPPVAKP